MLNFPLVPSCPSAQENEWLPVLCSFVDTNLDFLFDISHTKCEKNVENSNGYVKSNIAIESSVIYNMYKNVTFRLRILKGMKSGDPRKLIHVETNSCRIYYCWSNMWIDRYGSKYSRLLSRCKGHSYTRFIKAIYLETVLHEWISQNMKTNDIFSHIFPQIHI